jgi:hypothetical protein
VAAAITKEIEYQATRPSLDYSNRTLWPFDYYNDINPLFMHAVWVKDYVLAYDITKAMGHSSPTVERWFLDLAELNEQAVHANLSSVFPNRKKDSYSSRASLRGQHRAQLPRALRTAKPVEYPRIMHFYNNRRSNQAGFYGLVGVVLDNTRYKEEFKRYAREWVMFGHRVTSSDGYTGDVNRGIDSFPQLGFSYGLHAMESLIPAMDGLARQGDTSLYEFSSREGAATPTGGTNHYKTMEGVLDTYVKWIKGTYPAQYTASGEPPTDLHRRKPLLPHPVAETARTAVRSSTTPLCCYRRTTTTAPTGTTPSCAREHRPVSPSARRASVPSMAGERTGVTGSCAPSTRTRTPPAADGDEEEVLSRPAERLDERNPALVALAPGPYLNSGRPPESTRSLSVTRVG